MTTLPNLSSLVLSDGRGARSASVSAQHGLAIPDDAVCEQFLRKKLPPVAYSAPGILVSAGLSKKPALEKLMERNRPTHTWSDGFLYAYYGRPAASDTVVVFCQDKGISFSLLGGYLVNPWAYLMAKINLYWNASGRPGNGALIDVFSSNEVIMSFYKKLWYDKRLPALNREYGCLSQMLDAIRRGEQLPMMWSDDGMLMVEEFTNAFYKNLARKQR